MLQVTHKFVSSKPEQTDPTLIGPSEWNSPHTVVDTNQLYYASDYLFPPQMPGINLSGGMSNTITLTPVPIGVSASDIGHYLYISGGTGTPEAVLITGGTAVSGAASGTINFVPANSHSGSWVISTATCGIQEALQVMQTGGCLKLNPALPCTLHAKVTPPNGIAYCIDGTSSVGISIKRAADYPNGDLFLLGVNNGFIQFRDLAINDDSGSSQTVGAVIHVVNTSVDINNVFISAGRNSHIGLLLDGTVNAQISNFKYTAVGVIFAAIQLISTTGINSDVNIVNASILLPFSGTSYGIWAQSVDGLKILNTTINGGFYQLWLNPAGQVNEVTSVEVCNCYFLNSGDESIRFDTSTSNNLNNIRILGCQINGENSTNAAYGIDIGLTTNANGIINVQVIGNQVTNWHGSGIAVGPGSGSDSSIIISGNVINNNNTGNFAAEAGIHLKTVVGVLIVGNYLENNQAFGIYLDSGDSDVTIVGNDFFNNPVAFGTTGSMTGVFKNNNGVDNVIVSIPSATNLTVPINPNFVITGNTPITQLIGSNLVPGATGTFRTPSASIAIGGSSSIGNPITTTINVFVSWLWDGSQFWLK